MIIIKTAVISDISLVTEAPSMHDFYFQSRCSCRNSSGIFRNYFSLWLGFFPTAYVSRFKRAGL